MRQIFMLGQQDKEQGYGTGSFHFSPFSSSLKYEQVASKTSKRTKAKFYKITYDSKCNNK